MSNHGIATLNRGSELPAACQERPNSIGSESLAANPRSTIRNPRSQLIVLSGPGGTGKTTVARRLLERKNLPLEISVSATTRMPRPGEVDGVHYHFLSREEFDRRRQRGEFVECAEVFGNFYGTLRSELESRLSRGRSVLLEIDVQGALEIKRQFPEAVLIFLKTPSMDEYERRLRLRATDDEQAIRRRLEGARQELARADAYDYEVVNDQLDQAVRDIEAILCEAGGNHSAG